MNKKTIKLHIELVVDYECPGIAMTEDLFTEVSFSDEEVARIRQLVKDSTCDEEAGLMPVLEQDAPALYQRVSEAADKAIKAFRLIDGIKNDYIKLDEDQMRKNFKEDYESGVFKPSEFIEDSLWYDELPEDEEDLFYLWAEWQHEVLTVSDAPKVLSRNPGIEAQLEEFTDESYLCFIPEEFKQS